jgi:hypothetical protein
MNINEWDQRTDYDYEERMCLAPIVTRFPKNEEWLENHKEEGETE